MRVFDHDQKVPRHLLEDKVVTMSRAQGGQTSPPTRQFRAGLHPKPMDGMIGFIMPVCSDGTVLFRASSARGSERVLLYRKCRSGVVVHSHAAVLHTVRRFGLASRSHHGCEKYLIGKTKQTRTNDPRGRPVDLY